MLFLDSALESIATSVYYKLFQFDHPQSTSLVGALSQRWYHSLGKCLSRKTTKAKVIVHVVLVIIIDEWKNQICS